MIGDNHMPIQYDINSLRQQLDRPENKELSVLIIKEVRYAVEQHRNVHAQNKEYLILSTVMNLIKLFNEYPLMIDGRNNTTDNNNEPF